MAGIVEGDYRMDGKNQLIACSVDGEGKTLFVQMCVYSHIIQGYRHKDKYSFQTKHYSAIHSLELIVVLIFMLYLLHFI